MSPNAPKSTSKPARTKTARTPIARKKASARGSARVKTRARAGGSAAPKAKAKPAPQAISTISFVSLGCPKNLVDSEKMLGLLAESGLTPVSSQQENFGGADAVVINTCGFLEASKDESLGVIKEAIEAKKTGNVKRVVVAGCLVQRHRAKMLEWAPGIDAMVGVFDRDRIVEAVMGTTAARKERVEKDAPKYWIAGNALVAAAERGVKTAGLTVNGKDAKGVGYFEDDSSRLRLTPRHYAYLRISEGCNQNCAFCTIPSIRGKMRSKGPDRIVSEARELLLDGAFELLLIGQDTTSFGDDIGRGLSLPPGGRAGEGLAHTTQSRYGLPGLLKDLSTAVKETSGSGWMRLMYAYPSNFSDEIIDAFADLVREGSLLPYLDIPLQHASDRVLSLMRRHVTREKQAHVVKRLKERVPGMAIRTTFISGFPGETEDDHKQLVDFVREMEFENVGVFEYSREDGTVAGTMEKDATLAVPADVKARRREEVMAAQQKIVFARNKAMAAKFDESRPLDGNGKARGVVTDVLIDAPLRTQGRKTTGVGEGGGLYQGRTSAQAPQIDGVTFVQSRDKLVPGELVRCVIMGWDGYDLVAKPVAELEKRVGLKILKNGC
ncbi:MAG TPA: 30S ribosomal protein S12 methylthiotransferase RimO [Phycisphaerales bacterium]|nr:30S ribosomal protein S12 methylthiotransferase RimO [Phycisphaerales bacterium]